MNFHYFYKRFAKSLWTCFFLFNTADTVMSFSAYTDIINSNFFLFFALRTFDLRAFSRDFITYHTQKFLNAKFHAFFRGAHVHQIFPQL